LAYVDESARPLTILVFLLPLIVVYELGTWHYATDPGGMVERRVRAFQWMQEFFVMVGATGRYLPPLTVVGVLLSWHIARGDVWRVRPGVLAGMTVEGIAWSLPLLAVSLVAVRLVTEWLSPLSVASSSGNTSALLVLSIGAGVYEELVFRLIAFALLSLLLMDLLRIGRWISAPLIVIVSAACFAFYHYLGGEPFSWQSMVFRTFAGVYLGALMLSRGFGITAFAHICYDIFVVLIQARPQG
jgi:membrane protease YdiL (CAAX protease family)